MHLQIGVSDSGLEGAPINAKPLTGFERAMGTVKSNRATGIPEPVKTYRVTGIRNAAAHPKRALRARADEAPSGELASITR